MAEAETTTLGTPISPQWTRAWVGKVESVEKQMGRRICGAHSPAWTPCRLGSTHRNGRCRFHGGAEGIGAPNGNRNALIHGLYSRRLQRCGMQCPVWKWCPMAGKDVLALDPKERPACVYEREEYDALTSSLGKGPAGRYEGVSKKKPKDLTVSSIFGNASGITDTQSPSPGGSGEERAKACEPPSPPPGLPHQGEGNESRNDAESAATPLLHHNIAMYQVMLTRAGAALSVARFVDEARAEGERYSMTSTRVAALLEAHMRIGRELRQWIKLLANDGVRFALGLGPSKPEDPEPEEVQSLPMLMMPILKKAEGVLEASLEPWKPKPGPSTA